MRKVSILLVVLLLITGSVAFAAENESDELTILFTHDMHSHVLPATAQIDGKKTEYGGFARLKTAIDNEKLLHNNVLVVDAGDFSMGTLFQTVFSSDAAELRLLGELGYEAVTLGNHEFDYRGKGLADMINSAKAKSDKLPYLTVSNINWPQNSDETIKNIKTAMNNYGVKDYFIFEKNSLKIAVFGLIGYDSIECAPMAEVSFEDTIESAKKTVESIKQNESVDMIVCLSHSGTDSELEKSEDHILAKEVPDIDVIISGHTHSVAKEPMVEGNTLIVSVGEYCANLGSMTVKRDNDGNWKEIGYELIPIDDSLEEDESINILINEFKQNVQDEYLDRFNLKFDEVIAYSPFDFTPMDEFGSVQCEDTLGNLIADSYVYSVKQAEGDNYEPIVAAIVPRGVVRGSFTKGNITVADAFNVSSLGIGRDGLTGYPLISIYLTGSELKAVAEVDASVTPIMSAAQLYIRGLRYEFNPNRLIFNKVTDIKLVNEDGNTEPIQDDKLYRVVSGLYSAQMLNAVNSKSFGILSVTPKAKDGTTVENFEDQIINAPYGEIKEWYSLANYLMSFDNVDGVPQVPEYYNTTHDRKIVNNSKNIFELIKNPNKVFFILVSVIIILIAIITIIIRLIYRKIKHKRISKNALK